MTPGILTPEDGPIADDPLQEPSASTAPAAPRSS